MSPTTRIFATPSTKILPVHIRWMVEADKQQVLQIEEESFGPNERWRYEDYRIVLRQMNGIGQVAEVEGQVVGYMVYVLEPSMFALVKLAVDKRCRGRKVGQQMLRFLANKLQLGRRTNITCEVAERNLGAQLFFRSLGFKCVNVLSFPLQDEAVEDMYQMEYNFGHD